MNRLSHAQVLPLLTAPVVMSVCEQLLKLYHLHQRFLNRSATAALSAALAAQDVRHAAPPSRLPHHEHRVQAIEKWPGIIQLHLASLSVLHPACCIRCAAYSCDSTCPDARQGT